MWMLLYSQQADIRTGIIWVIPYQQAQFVSGFTKCFNGFPNSKEAEAIGMREAILWVMRQGYE